MYRIKNISKSNIVINNKTIKQDETMKIDSLDDLGTLIELGIIEVELMNNIIANEVVQNQIKEVIDIDEFIEIFYKFYTNIDLNSLELNKLIWFYKNVGPTSILPEDVKNHLDSANNSEELIEMLINQIYPELLKPFRM